MTENIRNFQDNSVSVNKMKINGPPAKRKPLQCITNNEILDAKIKQTKQDLDLKQNFSSGKFFTPNLTSSSNNADNGYVRTNLDIVTNEVGPYFEQDENMQPLDLSIMECNETLDDDFLEDSIVIYSSDDNDDDDNEKDYQIRLSNMICMIEYKEDMYKFLKDTEVQVKPRANYMSKQLEITAKMRSIMIDWMVDVIEEFKHDRETLHLAVNYVDRFLSVMSVARAKLQLVGTTALWIAGKFEEIYPPGVKDYAFITDDTYTIQQVIRMEHLMLNKLDFDVAVPTANAFCERYIKEANVHRTTAHLARYLVDASLLYCDPFLNYLPSEIAASSILLANLITNQEYWPESLQTSTKYGADELKACMYSLYLMYIEAISSPYQAIRTKYIADKYECVAALPIPLNLLSQN